jgi:hypothetical protein
MTNRSNRGLGQPRGSKHIECEKLIGIRSADFIKASGHEHRADRPYT